MRLIGIDPDLNGGIAVVDQPSREVLWCGRMPVLEKKAPMYEKRRLDAHGAWAHLEYARRYYKAEYVILESAVVKSQMGGRMMGGIDTTHQTYGGLRSLCEVLYGKSRVRLARPSVWKKAMEIGSDKEKARLMAIDLFPSHSMLLGLKKNVGIAEALLLTEWGHNAL